MDERMMEIIKKAVMDEGFRAYHIEKRGKVIAVYIEKNNGSVNVEECKRVSEAVSLKLDAFFPEMRNYILEVSSPGVERFLYKKEHFKKSVGKKVYIKTEKEGFYGVITNVNDEGVEIESGKGKKFVKFDSIKSAQIKVTTEELFRRIN